MIEITNCVSTLLCFAILLAGLITIYKAPNDNLKQHILGLFCAIFGLVGIAIVKLWTQTKVTGYFTIWDRNNWIESEIRKS